MLISEFVKTNVRLLKNQKKNLNPALNDNLDDYEPFFFLNSKKKGTKKC